MNDLNRSALNRVGRGALQFLVSAGFVELVLQRLADLGLDPAQQLLLTGAIQQLVAYVHRRFLDPIKGLPTLVDGEAAAGTEYAGQRVAGDGVGPT